MAPQATRAGQWSMAWADYVNFSLEGDVTRLVKAGLVDETWNSGPTKGIVSDSAVVIVVQKGNPLGIKDWSDLVKPGVKIVTPNPASSGSARWNILAAYQQVIANGGTEAEAKEYLTKFFNHVAALPGSGRDATNAFLKAANVLISYENEAILARQSGEDFDYILPDATIKIEPGRGAEGANPKANAYLDFVLSKAGQEEFVKKGFRPVVADTPIGEVAGANDPAKPFPVPPRLFTISDLGGWEAVNAKFFDETTGWCRRFSRQQAGLSDPTRCDRRAPPLDPPLQARPPMPVAAACRAAQCDLAYHRVRAGTGSSTAVVQPAGADSADGGARPGFRGWLVGLLG